MSVHARCTGWSPRSDSPSIVVTLRPATAEVGVTHERTAAPSTCTVQAPHTAMPQPYLVPVRLSDSRRTQRRGISGGTSTCRGLPLTVNEIMTASWLELGRLHDTQIADRLSTNVLTRCERPPFHGMSRFFDSSRAPSRVGSSDHGLLHASAARGAADSRRDRGRRS